MKIGKHRSSNRYELVLKIGNKISIQIGMKLFGKIEKSVRESVLKLV